MTVEVILSPARISTFLICPRKFLFRYCLGLVPKAIVKPFSIGTAFHIAVSAYHRKQNMSSIGSCLREYYNSIINDERNAIQDENELVEERAKVSGMINSYVRNSPIYPTEVPGNTLYTDFYLENDGLVDDFFKIDIPKIVRLKFRGCIDRIIVYRNSIGIIDYKTSTRAMDSDYRDSLTMKSQILFYAAMIYLNTKYREIRDLITDRFSHLAYFVVKVPSLRLKQTETPVQYYERCEADCDNYFKEHSPIIDLSNKFDPVQCYYELRQIVIQIRRFLKSLQKKTVLPYYNDDSCYKYYRCPYLIICQNGLKESLLISHYNSVDPLYENKIEDD